MFETTRRTVIASKSYTLHAKGRLEETERGLAVVAAVSRSSALVFALSLVAIFSTRPVRAELPPVDAKEILGIATGNALKITSVAVRLTALEQSGRGYQSKAGRVSGPGSERLTVFEPQLEVQAKQGEKVSHRLWVPVDVVTAASPDAIDRDRRPPDVVSSASRRNMAGTLDWTMQYKASPNIELSFRNGLHLEEEWRAWHSGLTLSHAFAEQNTVLSLGVLSIFDWFDNFDLIGKRRGLSRRGSNTGSLALTQILSRTTVGELSYGLTVQNGTLGNNWNIVPLSDGSVGAEILPSLRMRNAFVGRIAQALPWNGVLKGYYRFYTDSWSIQGHTVEAQLLQRVSPQFSFAFGFRHHTQTAADFFTKRGAPNDDLRTADSDLSELDSDSLSGRAFVVVPWGQQRLNIDFAYERYWRSNKLAANIFTCSTGISL